MRIRNVFRTLKFAGAQALPEYDWQRSICIGVNVMSLFVIMLNVVFGFLFYLITHELTFLYGGTIEALLLIGVLALNYRRRYELANLIFYIIICVSTIYYAVILGKIAEVQLMILFILALTYFVFKNLRARVICIIIALCLLALLEANYIYDFVAASPLSRTVGLLIRWLVYCVIISLVLLIFYLYNKNTELLIRLHTYSKSVKASLLTEEKLNQLKNVFFQQISHDIRGAFFGVSSIANALRNNLAESKNIQLKELDTLVEASNHYRSMLDNFLELSKFKNASLDNINLEPINLREEMRKIENLHQYLANQKGVNIQIQFSLGFPELIIGDKLKVTRIIFNLLGNALKFTRNGSTILILIDHARESWTFTIKDQGDGIPSDRIKRIFDPYVTEKTAQNPEGVGLGLYITKYLADLLGAQVQVSSQVDIGTSFEVKFNLKRHLLS